MLTTRCKNPFTEKTEKRFPLISLHIMLPRYEFNGLLFREWGSAYLQENGGLPNSHTGKSSPSMDVGFLTDT